MPRLDRLARARRRGRRGICVLAAAALLVPGAGAARGAPRKPPANRLPLISVLKSPDLHVGSAADAPRLLGSSQEVLYGCDPYEVSQGKAQRCLRFDTLVLNAGLGALELRYGAAGAVSSVRATQRIYRADGSHVDRAAGFFSFDPAHQHFHYANFVVASLWRSDSRGRRLGSAPLRQGHKDGFCLEDLDPYRSDAGTAQYTFPTACYPVAQPDGSIAQVNGISPGWIDVYDLTLTNQSIEITGVPDGYYLLQITVDPLRTLLVDAHSRTTVSQWIRLCGNQVEAVGGTRQCGRSTTPATTGQQWRTVCAGGWCPTVPQTGRSRPGRLFG